jgi:radical SAM protein with 4Fe4S-binding SPASM domain
MIAPLTPLELKIEITDVCNLNCQFCYRGGEKHQGTRFMPEEEALRWIDWTVDNGLPAVRFTGGEATLHPQIEMFCYYAHLRGRYIILNTNGMGDDRLYRKLFGVVNDVRVSIPTLHAERMDTLTGGMEVLAKKRDVIHMALEAGVGRVCVLTALLPELHGTLENFVRIVAASPRLFWLPLRYESTPMMPRPWKRADAQMFAEEMADLMDRYPEEAQGIFLAMPFCGVKPASLAARVFHGRTQDCGPFVALNVNGSGRMQACFEVGEMGGARSLSEIRNSPEIHACASMEALPDECRRCGYVARCAGGCRKPYGLVQHNGREIDYLAEFVEQKSEARSQESGARISATDS